MRELHLEKGIDVIDVPSVRERPTIHYKQTDDLLAAVLIECPYFSVEKWVVKGEANLFQHHPFLLVSVIEGDGIMIAGGHEYPFRKGDHILLPSGLGEYKLAGHANCIVSHL